MPSCRPVTVVTFVLAAFIGVACQGEVVGMDPLDGQVAAPPDAAPDVGVDVGVPLPDAATEPACPEEIIYVVTQDGALQRYNPVVKRFDTVAALECESQGDPYSMAVSQDGLAYILYAVPGATRWTCDGIYTVDTITGACLGLTPYGCQNDLGVGMFGMGFGAGGPDATGETLYVAGLANTGMILGWIDRDSWRLRSVAPLAESLGAAELAYLAGSGLWAFFGYAAEPFAARIDTVTGALLEPLVLPVNGVQGAHALASWGGEGYAFFWAGGQGQIFRLAPGFVALHDTFPDSIVGAGSAPCP